MISIVIPAFNEEKTIASLLESFVHQETDREFEVIVVDNNSTDKTYAIAETFRRKLNLKVIREKRKGRSPARRAGFAAATGDIILSTDADTCVPKNWIDRMGAYFDDPKVNAISGPCRIDDLGFVKNTVVNVLQPVSMHIYRLCMKHYWLSGFNFGIRKKIYLEAGGFDQTLNTHEDTELALRVSKLGKITYIGSPVVTVSGRRFQDGLIRGVIPYATTFFSYFIFKRASDPNLSDVR